MLDILFLLYYYYIRSISDARMVQIGGYVLVILIHLYAMNTFTAANGRKKTFERSFELCCFPWNSFIFLWNASNECNTYNQIKSSDTFERPSSIQNTSQNSAYFLRLGLFSVELSFCE